MIEELSTKVTDFYYDYDPYEFKDNYENYNEGLEATQEVLSSKSETKKLISDLEQINDDLYENRKLKAVCLSRQLSDGKQAAHIRGFAGASFLCQRRI